MRDASGTSPESVGRAMIEELLSRRGFMSYDVDDVHSVHYAEACAALGALRLAGLLNGADLIERLKERYAIALDGKTVPNTTNHVDANVYGILPLEVYLQTKDGANFSRGLELADGQWEHPLPDGMSPQTRYWIDDVYMIACLQAQAYRATGESKYLDRATLEIEAYLKKLQRPNGLFHHGPDAPFFWGRGNGWVAAGLAELLSVLPQSHPRFASIRDGYLKMMDSLMRYQGDDGTWRQLIDREDAWKESSCTAMFGFAMSVGARLGLLDARDVGERCGRAWEALVSRVDPAGRLADVCAGTGQSAEASYYQERPRVTGDLHGQAALLWFACERVVR
jgi:unsaturated rhamnogalacturonyl hydrolase